MKILHTVESYLPYRHGMSEVVRQISERLALQGHEIIVATSYSKARKNTNINGVNIKQFNISGNYVKGFRGNIKEYKNYLLNTKVDIIVNFAGQIWTTDIALPILNKINSKKIFVPTGFSSLNNPKYEKYYRILEKWISFYDSCIFHSKHYQDYRWALKRKIKNLHIIPNGADEKEFKDIKSKPLFLNNKIPKKNKIVLHVAGYLEKTKGQLDAMQIFNKSKIPNLTLLVISKKFDFLREFILLLKFFLKIIIYPKKQFKLPYLTRLRINKLISIPRNISLGRQILFLSLNRSDLIKAFINADLFLFPSWEECSPIVLLEAAASKTPFLVTDVGNAKEFIRISKGGELLPSLQRFSYDCDAILDQKKSIEIFENLICDNDRLYKLGKQGYQTWYDKFRWSEIYKKYESIYLNLLNE